MTSSKADPAEIERGFRALYPDGATFEVRAFNCGDEGTVSGFFDDFATAAKAVARFDDRAIAPGVYVTVNPVSPAILARRANRIVANVAKGTSAADPDIVERQSFFIDCDPVKAVEGASATDAEKNLACQRASAIKAYLCDIGGWPAPIEADSGNGRHLLFRCKFPNDEESRIRFGQALRVLASGFGGAGVIIDTKVGNAARLTKAYGTMARKGVSTPDRPHRRSKILEVPANLIAVTREQFDLLAAQTPEPAQVKNASTPAAIDASSWLAKYGISVAHTKSFGGGTLYVLAKCYFSADHEDGAWVAQFPSGAITAGCHHDRCSGKGWRELRSMFEPEAYRFERSFSPTDRGAVTIAVGPPPELRLVTLDTVTPTLVEWLWAKRIPLGKLTMLVGDPGGGKTFVTLALASAVTRGRRLPDDAREADAPARVLILNFEDGTDDTIRPRAEKAGCDLTRTIVIEGVTEGDRQVPFGAHHVHQLDDVLDKMPDVRLLVIDPIAQLLGAVNTAKDNEVRTALQPLKELAERRNIAVVCIVHLRKAEAEKAMYRVSGSIAFVGFARSVLLVAQDETGRRSISRIKGNLSIEPDPVEFAIDDEGVFAWRGTAPELSAENMLSPAKREKADELSEFLRGELADGPRLAAELYALGKERGYSEDKLKRARKACGIEVNKEPTFPGRWVWSLPSDRPLRVTPHSSRPSRSSSDSTQIAAADDDDEIEGRPKGACALPKESIKSLLTAEGRKPKREGRTPKAEEREGRTVSEPARIVITPDATGRARVAI